MSVFFNGQLLTTPTTASAIDDSGLANKNLSVGNVVALIGSSEGGTPNAVYRFGTPEQAKATLRSGDLLNGILKAFDPSAETGGPSEVVAIRVNPAIQATLNLLDGSGSTALALRSADYGDYTNKISVKLESGTKFGKKVTLQLGDKSIYQDNVGLELLQVSYSGALASATISATSTEITLAAPAGSTVATIALASFNTLKSVIDKINTVPGFSAVAKHSSTVLSTITYAPDKVTAVDVKTNPYIVSSHLRRLHYWFNSSPASALVRSTLGASGDGTPPSNIATTNLSGGSNGVVTNTNWSDAYEKLKQVDVQWVVPMSVSASIHAMNDTHCAFMSDVAGMERRGIVGTGYGTTNEAAIAAAEALNSDRTSLVHIGIKDYNAAGALVTYPAFITAALLAGMFAGVNPGTPLTNKSIKVRGLERELFNPTETDELIKGGVLCVERTKKGYKVVQSITTWLVNDNYNRVEVSTGVAVDFVVRNVREALDDLRGQKGSPVLITRAASITESRLRELARPEPQGPGVIVGDAANPAYRNIRSTIEADVLRVEFECQPAIGVNYVLLTVAVSAYSGTAVAAEE